MSKVNKDPMKRETQIKETGKTLKDLRKIQKEPTPIGKVSLGDAKKKI